MTAHRSVVRSRLESGRDLRSGPLRTLGRGNTARSRPIETATRRQPSWVGAAIVCVVAGCVFASPLVATVGPLTSWVAQLVLRRRRAQRSRRAAERSVLDMVDRIAQQLRGGDSLAAATESAIAEANPSLDRHLWAARSARASGEGLAEALRRVDVAGLAPLELAISSLRLLLVHSGPAAVSIERVAETLRAGASARDEVAAQGGQATASAALLAVLPLVFASIVAVAEPAAARLYLQTWVGAGCLGGAVALSATSWWWIDRAVHQ